MLIPILVSNVSVGLILRSVNLLSHDQTGSRFFILFQILSLQRASKAKLYRFISAVSQSLHQNLLASKVLNKLLKKEIYLNVEISQ